MITSPFAGVVSPTAGTTHQAPSGPAITADIDSSSDDETSFGPGNRTGSFPPDSGDGSVTGSSVGDGSGSSIEGTVTDLRSIELDQTKSGTIDSSDPSNSTFRGNYEPVTFSGEAGHAVRINMMSSDDTYLFLLDPNGTIIAEDDDGGENLNSSIETVLPETGTYTIIATSYDDTATFEYTLTLSLQRGFDLTGVDVGFIRTHSEDTGAIEFQNDLSAQGADLHFITTTLNDSLLDGFDVLVVREGGSGWTASERSTLEQWVNDGGGLLIDGDQHPTEVRDLTSVFGIESTGLSSSGGPTTSIAPHPVTSGVGTVEVPGPVTTLNITKSSIADTLVWDPAGEPTIAAAQSGGRLLFLGDDYIEHRFFDEDNRKLFNQGVAWLAGGPDSAAFDQIIDDPNESDITVDIDTVSTLIDSERLYFNFTYHDGWTDAHADGLNTAAFLDIDRSNETGANVSNYFDGLDSKTDWNRIGADYAIVVGVEGDSLWKWNDTADSWNTGYASLSFLSLSDNDDTFEVGVLKSDLGDPGAIAVQTANIENMSTSVGPSTPTSTATTSPTATATTSPTATATTSPTATASTSPTSAPTATISSSSVGTATTGGAAIDWAPDHGSDAVVINFVNVTTVSSSGFPTVNVSIKVDTSAGMSGSLSSANFSVEEDGTAQSVGSTTFDSATNRWTVQYTTSDPRRDGSDRSVTVTVDDPDGTDSDSGSYVAPTLSENITVLDVNVTQFPIINVSVDVDTAAGRNGTLPSANFSVSEEGRSESLTAVAFNATSSTWLLTYNTSDRARKGQLRNVTVTVVDPTGIGSGSGDYIAPKDFLAVTGTDPGEFPAIRTFAQVDTEAGRNGNLTKGNFTLWEDGTLQSIDSVTFTGANTSNKSALDIAFVFDDTGSMGGEIDAMKDQVTAFTDRLNGSRDVRFALVSFKDSPEIDQNYTANATLFKNAVDDLFADGGGDGPEDNLDALEMAMRNLTPRGDAQKVLVDITDNVAHYRGDGSGFANYTMPEVEDDIKRRGYTYIAVSPDFPSTTSLSGAANDGGSVSTMTNTTDVDKRTLANHTDGLWIDIHGTANFTQILDQIGARLSTTWIVRYDTSNPVRDGTLRDITLTVDDPNRRVDSDTGLYIAPTLAERMNLTDVNSSAFPTVHTTLEVNTSAGRNGTLDASNFTLREDGSVQTITSVMFNATEETYWITYNTTATRRDGTVRGVSITLTEPAGVGTVGDSYVAPTLEDALNVTDVDASGFPTIRTTVDVNTTSGENGNLTESNFSVLEDGSPEVISSVSFNATAGTYTLVHSTTNSTPDGTLRNVTVLLDDPAGIDNDTGQYFADYVDITGIDPTQFPTVRTFIGVNTPAGLSGNLTKSNFTLSEDGVRQTIDSVRFAGNTTTTTKLDMVFVFDRSGSMGDEIDELRRKIKNTSQTLNESGIDARFGLVTFADDYGRYDQNLTRNVTELEQALDAVSASGGTERNFDALWKALQLDYRPDAQKIVVDITDEDADHGNLNLSQIAQQLNERAVTYIAISPDFSSGTAISSVDEDGGDTVEPAGHFGPTDKRVLANETAGIWIDIASADFSRIIDQIGARLTTTWIIQYNTTNAIFDGTVRDVNVTVDDPDRRPDNDIGQYIAPTLAARMNITSVDRSAFPTIRTSMTIDTPDGRNGTLDASNFTLREDGTVQTIRSLTFHGGNDTWVLEHNTTNPTRDGTSRTVSVTVNESAGEGTVSDRYSAPSLCFDINSPGRYTLDQSIMSGAAGACIRITASDVILDGQGHAINVTGSGNAVNVSASSPIANVTIRNLTVENGGTGIVVHAPGDNSNVTDLSIVDNRIDGPTTGIDVAASGTNEIVDIEIAANDITNVSSGLYVDASGDASDVWLAIQENHIEATDRGIEQVDVTGRHTDARVIVANNSITSSFSDAIQDVWASGFNQTVDVVLAHNTFEAAADGIEDIEATGGETEFTLTVFNSTIVAGDDAVQDVHAYGTDAVVDVVFARNDFDTSGDGIEDLDVDGWRANTSVTIVENNVTSGGNAIDDVDADNSAQTVDVIIVDNQLKSDWDETIDFIDVDGTDNLANVSIVNNSITSGYIGIGTIRADNSDQDVNFVIADNAITADSDGISTIAVRGSRTRGRLGVINNSFQTGNDGINSILADGTDSNVEIGIFENLITPDDAGIWNLEMDGDNQTANVLMANNVITDFGSRGLSVGSVQLLDANDLDLTLVNNWIESDRFGTVGIYVDPDSGTGSAAGTIDIEFNHIRTTESAVMMDFGPVDGIGVHDNFLAAPLGVKNRNTTTGTYLNATHNYWNASDGPGSVGPLEDPVTGTLADGSGSNVTAATTNVSNVHFDPFLTSPPVREVTPTVQLASARIGEGSVGQVDLTVDEVPEGLSGYLLNVTLENGTVADFTGATYPSAFNASLTNTTITNGGDTIRLKAVDTGANIEPGDANILLASIDVLGTTNGTTNATISIIQMDDDNGSVISPDTETGTIRVGPVCSPIASGFPVPTDPDGDGDYEDLNGNGRVDFNDVVILFEEMAGATADCQDFNGNGGIDFDDIVTLFESI